MWNQYFIVVWRSETRDNRKGQGHGSMSKQQGVGIVIIGNRVKCPTQ